MLSDLLTSGGFAPHGYCLLWDPALIWTHIASDLLIAAAYFSIPLALVALVRRRGDVAFGWVFWLFAIFITACGITHVMSVWTLYHADYWAEGIIKAITAVASVGTAAALWPLIPRLLAIPSPSMLAAKVAERDAALGALRREQAEREAAEEALRQSQKMEAVGRLTGGIAHDFNNLLAIVIGNLDRIDRKFGSLDPQLKRSVDHAMQGAERAAGLTRQLLAFARKQTIVVEPVDLNRIVLDLSDLLDRSLEGRGTVDLQLAPEPLAVRVDRNQTEAALLNLVVNARDAIADGGHITVRTGHARVDDGIGGVEPGDYVALTVEDDGAGMDADTLAKALEPFFTTKDIGKGTGLGLSQVDGIMRQFGGGVAIDSAPGRGTAVTLYFPRALTERAPQRQVNGA